MKSWKSFLSHTRSMQLFRISLNMRNCLSTSGGNNNICLLCDRAKHASTVLWVAILNAVSNKSKLFVRNLLASQTIRAFCLYMYLHTLARLALPKRIIIRSNNGRRHVIFTSASLKFQWCRRAQNTPGNKTARNRK